MKTRRVLLFVAPIAMLFTQCIGNIREQSNRQFGDQHFKTAIALIELHKVRFGAYPDSLERLKYVGDWDRMAFSNVRYQKLDSGYALDLTNGWLGMPDTLAYPDSFWMGIGLVRSNMKR